jgi:muconate cycloisomerase
VKIVSCELSELDLPLRKTFRHAAAARRVSESLLLTLITEDGSRGCGESLPRKYVTGETRTAAFDLLAQTVLPRLVGMSFNDLDEVIAFLGEHDGRAPASWVDRKRPQTAAWCAVDLGLLDVFGRAFGRRVDLPSAHPPRSAPAHCGAVLSAGGKTAWWTLLKMRLYGFRQVKIKVTEAADPIGAVRRARRWLGTRCELRVDTNMAWDPATAAKRIPALRELGVVALEQPVPPEHMAALKALKPEIMPLIMADETMHDRESLQRLIADKSCDAVNVRIAKCGGLIAAHRRCGEVLKAGLALQIGCHVGESSLLSAAQRALLDAWPQVRWIEGFYSEHLLTSDPGRPRLQFGYGGAVPERPAGPGFGVTLDPDRLKPYIGRQCRIGTSEEPRAECRPERIPSS